MTGSMQWHWSITMIMTKKQLIDKLQPFFYDDHIDVRTCNNGTIEVYINGFYYDRERLNKHTGIDLNMIKIKEVNNLTLWRELVR